MDRQKLSQADEMVATIPTRRIPLALAPAEPTPITADGLRQDLARIGLTCDLASKVLLKQYIEEVTLRLPAAGEAQTYSILKPTRDPDGRIADLVGDYAKASTGNWQPAGTALGYAVDLETIIYEPNFDLLASRHPAFGGIRGTDTKKGRYDTVGAVKEMFVQVGSTMSSLLVKGLDQASIKSVLANAIAPLDDKNAKDYDKTSSRVIFLVLDYDEDKQEAGGVGVMSISWRLQVKDYKEKKKTPQYDSELSIWGRSVVFDSMIFEDYYKELQRAGLALTRAGMPVPVKDPVVKVYDKLPPADRATFDNSLPLEADDQGAYALVLYSPDLQAIGSLDNTNSTATSTYEKSVMTGFTFSSTQTLSATAKFEAGIVLAKGGVEVGMSLSFTEEYTKQTTETVSIVCDPGEKNFTYQGSLLSARLRYSPETQSFAYEGPKAKYLTEVFVATKAPLTAERAVMVGGPSMQLVAAGA